MNEVGEQQQKEQEQQIDDNNILNLLINNKAETTTAGIQDDDNDDSNECFYYSKTVLNPSIITHCLNGNFRNTNTLNNEKKQKEFIFIKENSLEILQYFTSTKSLESINYQSLFSIVKDIKVLSIPHISTITTTSSTSSSSSSSSSSSIITRPINELHYFDKDFKFKDFLIVTSDSGYLSVLSWSNIKKQFLFVQHLKISPPGYSFKYLGEKIQISPCNRIIGVCSLKNKLSLFLVNGNNSSGNGSGNNPFSIISKQIEINNINGDIYSFNFTYEKEDLYYSIKDYIYIIIISKLNQNKTIISKFKFNFKDNNNYKIEKILEFDENNQKQQDNNNNDDEVLDVDEILQRPTQQPSQQQDSQQQQQQQKLEKLKINSNFNYEIITLPNLIKNQISNFNYHHYYLLLITSSSSSHGNEIKLTNSNFEIMKSIKIGTEQIYDNDDNDDDDDGMNDLFTSWDWFKNENNEILNLLIGNERGIIYNIEFNLNDMNQFSSGNGSGNSLTFAKKINFEFNPIQFLLNLNLNDWLIIGDLSDGGIFTIEAEAGAGAVLKIETLDNHSGIIDFDVQKQKFSTKLYTICGGSNSMGSIKVIENSIPTNVLADNRIQTIATNVWCFNPYIIISLPESTLISKIDIDINNSSSNSNSNQQHQPDTLNFITNEPTIYCYRMTNQDNGTFIQITPSSIVLFNPMLSINENTIIWRSDSIGNGGSVITNACSRESLLLVSLSKPNRLIAFNINLVASSSSSNSKQLKLDEINNILLDYEISCISLPQFDQDQIFDKENEIFNICCIGNYSMDVIFLNFKNKQKQKQQLFSINNNSNSNNNHQLSAIPHSVLLSILNQQQQQFKITSTTTTTTNTSTISNTSTSINNNNNNNNCNISIDQSFDYGNDDDIMSIDDEDLILMDQDLGGNNSSSSSVNNILLFKLLIGLRDGKLLKLDIEYNLMNQTIVASKNFNEKVISNVPISIVPVMNHGAIILSNLPYFITCIKNHLTMTKIAYKDDQMISSASLFNYNINNTDNNIISLNSSGIGSSSGSSSINNNNNNNQLSSSYSSSSSSSASFSNSSKFQFIFTNLDSSFSLVSIDFSKRINVRKISNNNNDSIDKRCKQNPNRLLFLEKYNIILVLGDSNVWLLNAASDLSLNNNNNNQNGNGNRKGNSSTGQFYKEIFSTTYNDELKIKFGHSIKYWEQKNLIIIYGNIHRNQGIILFYSIQLNQLISPSFSSATTTTTATATTTSTNNDNDISLILEKNILIQDTITSVLPISDGKYLVFTITGNFIVDYNSGIQTNLEDINNAQIITPHPISISKYCNYNNKIFLSTESNGSDLYNWQPSTMTTTTTINPAIALDNNNNPVADDSIFNIISTEKSKFISDTLFLKSSNNNGGGGDYNHISTIDKYGNFKIFNINQKHQYLPPPQLQQPQQNDENNNDNNINNFMPVLLEPIAQYSLKESCLKLFELSKLKNNSNNSNNNNNYSKIITCSFLGSVIVLGKLSKIEYLIFNQIQNILKKGNNTKPLLNNDHQMYRSEIGTTKNILDGDLLSQFLYLDDLNQFEILNLINKNNNNNNSNLENNKYLILSKILSIIEEFDNY